MGQLEKYGLYVLCLVIFLILGVTIWGGGELPVTHKQTSQAPIVAPGGAGSGAGSAVPGTGVSGGGSKGTKSAGDVDLDALFGPAPHGTEPKKGDAKPAEATGTKSEPGPSGGDAKGKGKAAEVPKVPPTDAARPTYKVQARDTLEGIAKEKLGNASLHPMITKLNPGIEPTKLHIGDELRLPTEAEIAQLTAHPDTKTAAHPDTKTAPGPKAKEAGGTYRVKKGDTFEGIALSQLGSRSRVSELRDLNPSVEPTNLHIGMTIRLPK